MSTTHVWSDRLDRRVTPFLLIGPFFGLFAIFGLFPLLYTAWISLHRWHLVGGGEGFVGVDNYTRLLSDPLFYNAMLNTVSIFILATFPQMFAALGLAALLNQPLRGPTFWRASVLMPNVVSVATIGLVFGQLYANDYGVVDYLLRSLGLPAIDWHGNRLTSHLAISTMVAWRWTGYNALLYLAAMQSVPQELYDAAALDGASRWRTFWSITVPGIRPTLIFTVVVSTISGLQLFAEPQLFDSSGSGGASRQFQTLAMYLYEKGFNQFNAGYAATIAWVMCLFCVGFALVNFVLVRKIASKD